MKRRLALRNIGVFFGYSITSSTLISLLKSCKDNEDEYQWEPEFFPKDMGQMLAQLVDVIIPESDTPSATDVGVHRFIDHFALTVLTSTQKKFLQKTMEIFLNSVLTYSGINSITEIKGFHFNPILQRYLAPVSDEEAISRQKLINRYNTSIKNGNPIDFDEHVASYAFASDIRNLTILAYKNSAYIGKNVLAYLPVPGEYIPCAKVNNLTKGKDWTL